MGVDLSSRGGARHRNFERYLGVWQGDLGLNELASLTTPGYLGHLGSRERDLAGLTAEISAYRETAPSVRFLVEHRFGQGDFFATRLSARGTSAVDGSELVAAGLNISRWENERLAEEWAIWEPLHPPSVIPRR